MEETHIALSIKDYVMIYGAIFTSVTTLVAVVGSYLDLKSNVKLTAFRLDRVDATIEDLKRAATSDKVQDERILQLQKEMFDLKHGQGFIQNSIDGMWSRTGKIKDAT